MTIATGLLTVLSSVAAISCLYNGLWWTGLILGLTTWVLAVIHLRVAP